MKNGQTKKRFLLSIIFTLLLLPFTSAHFAVKATDSNEKQLDIPEKITESLEDYVTEETEDDYYKPTDKVRIIVELDEEPAISYATEQGVLYKELDDQVQEQLQDERLSAQDAIISDISRMGITFDVEHQFTTVVNGFSTEVTYKEYDVIQSIDGIEDVHISNVYHLPEEQEPDMNYSIDIIQAGQVWEDYGLDGEGMIIGIIDTGIDPTHQDMALDSPETITLNEDIINQMKDDHELDGIYFTDKVPYGYNYMDKNTQIIEQGPAVSNHGIHVAGSAAANGEIKGVAPNAQLLALRVFGDDPQYTSTYGDIYVKAIDDAILLGADVINLSLGSVAGFVRPTDPEQEAISRAVDNGIIASISAGNSAYYANAITANYPLATNPDIGLTGSPSVSYDSIGVASIENTFIEMEGFSWSSDQEEGTAAFLASNRYHEDVDQPLELIHIVHNNSLDQLVEALAEKDVEGKIVLLQRGLNFIDKAIAVQEAGGAGVMVYNHSAGYTSMATNSSIVIPQLFISKTDGEHFAQLLDNDEAVSIVFSDGEPIVTANPEAGRLSSFTSWGVAPNLDFKPELTAPGGNILSTLQDNEYGLKSGTSMAAPHVSGGSALVLQHVDEHFDLSGYDRSIAVKNLLLNTSTIIEDKNLYNDHYALGNPYSPRRQGSGVMDLHAALATPVVVTEVNTGEAKVSLQEVGDSFTFTLAAENFSNQDVTYELDGNVQTDLVVSGQNLIEAQGVFEDGTIAPTSPWLGEYPIAFSDDTLTIPAGQTVEFTVTVDLTNAIDWFYEQPLENQFPNGTFIEGFVTLTNESFPTLAVPYVGFYGSWDDAPILDGKRYEEDFFLPHTGLVNENGSYLAPIDEIDGFDETNIIAFSPNKNDIHNKVTPVLTFLRNAESVQYNVLDHTGDRLRTIKRERDIRKTHDLPGYSYLTDRTWDGTVNRKQVDDGLYYYEVRAKIDFDDAKWQSFTFPVLVDTTDPELSVRYHTKEDEVKWQATDQGSGLQQLQVILDDEVVETITISEDHQEQSGTIDASEWEDGTVVEVVAFDRAGNSISETAEVNHDTVVPYIYITTPEVLSVHDTHDIAVKGYIEEDSGLASFTINEQAIEFEYNESEDHYTFDAVISFESDGAPDLFFDAVDSRGNQSSIKRQIIIDTTPPELTIEVPDQIDQDATEVTLNVSVADNFNGLKLYVNDSHEYEQPFKAPYQESFFEDEFELTVKLDDGDTDLYFELVDVAGNTAEEEITITRSKDDDEAEDDPNDGDKRGKRLSLGSLLKNLFTKLFSFIRF
ncbi:S8 family serine peptidase [Amphibacillus cookii]|uniref:S8 family serine peptidase n=1 Tax=Amphibacillus cookii TaxID=767787 RepID=UPI00195A76A8|nr:S8 family serine peptidase [Amphibacillus cookii]MBM7540292.1 lactocepin [Amphibacillus cookii]